MDGLAAVGSDARAAGSERYTRACSAADRIVRTAAQACVCINLPLCSEALTGRRASGVARSSGPLSAVDMPLVVSYDYGGSGCREGEIGDKRRTRGVSH